MLLSLDQGTHGSRALLFDDAGQQLAQAHCKIHIHSMDNIFIEQDPQEVLDSLDSVLDSIKGQYPTSPTMAGLACQRSSIVCWDRRNGKALSPILSWQDRRGFHQIQQLQQHRTYIKEETGLVLSPHYGASKIHWCLHHINEVAAAQRQGNLVCTPLSSFLTYHLSQDAPIVVDSSNAARTLLWSIHTLDWHPALLDLFSLPGDILAPCVPNRFDFGRLKKFPDTPLQLVIGDQAAATFANGHATTDQIFINLGTGCFVLNPCFNKEKAHPSLLQGILYQDKKNLFCTEGTVNGGDAAIQWFFQQYGGDWQLLSRANPQHRQFFMNGIGGLGSPYWRDIPTGFFGKGDTADQFLALLESIVFLVQINLDLIKASRAGAPPWQLLLSGGLAQQDIMCQMLADMNRSSVFRSRETEATARGVAYLLSAMQGRQQAWPQDRQEFTPRPHTELQGRFQTWRAYLEERTGT